MKGISAALSKGLVEQRGNFLWPRGLGRPTIRAYDQNGETRPIQEVAPEEIQGAVLAVLEVSFAMPREDLAVSVARFLGYERLGAIVRTEVFAAIDALLDANAVVRTGDQIRAA
jgi:hypothetical protein